MSALKPAHLRQRTNRKHGAALLEVRTDVDVPPIPNPDGRTWHELTVQSWARAWQSPMAGEWVESDFDTLGRLALLWDAYYQKPGTVLSAEIRLMEQRFGLSPLDRSRLQWEVNRGAEAEQRKSQRQKAPSAVKDPRQLLKAVG